MKMIDGLRLEGKSPIEIPDCSRDEFPDFFEQLGFKIGAEIGVSMGENMELYCKKGFKMYGIDPYLDYKDNRYRPLNRMHPYGDEGKTVDGVYRHAMNRLSKYENFTMIRKMSMDALSDIPNRSLDFIYIDGNHKYGYVAMDLMKWSEKVRKGGILAGHDYYSTKGARSIRQVGPAVDGFVRAFDIEKLYMVGRKIPFPGEKNDVSLSFFCFKHW